MIRLSTASFVTALLLFAPLLADAQRIKDIAAVEGTRTNQLIGYGLVVGLDGTGDTTTQTPFTVQAFTSMLREFGIQLPPGINLQLKNVAGVSVTAELPAFARPGQRLDVTVASIGNANSLRGGSLLLTPLKGIDGSIYAIAQGNLAVGGFGGEGQDGSRITVNVPSVGRIPNGASVERAAPSTFGSADGLRFLLHRADFTTARHVADAINNTLGPGIAAAVDAGTVLVSAPADPGQRVTYLSVLENLDVVSGEASARVIINSRTGTIVISKHVEVLPAAVTHGSLTVTISERLAVSQPGAFGDGETVVVPESQVEIEEASNPMFRFPAGVSLKEIVAAVNEVGAAPGDLMAILEALREAGALQAEIVVI